ncbi:MAG: leucine-rich repeat domain-containing protein [Clostridia bacterium]|nr:leucine-rich repeat domain-containing protein [Clostridia bacterium]
MENVSQRTRESNLIMLTDALEKAQNGVLVVPKEYDVLTKEDANLIETYGIHTIEFEEGSKLQLVTMAAFYKKTFLKKIDFTNCEKLETIGMWAFTRCENLEEVIFAENNNLKTVKAHAFEHTGLTEMNFHNSKLELLGDYAFWGNDKLKVLDMSKCKELKTVGTGITNESRMLELWDMSGCTKIKFMDANGTRAKTFRVNANLRGNSNGNFWQTMFGGTVEIWDFDKCQESFEVTSTQNLKSLERLRVLSTGYLKHLRRVGLWPKITLNMINDIQSDDDLNFLVKNFDEIRPLLKRMMVEENTYNAVWRLLQMLGYKGFKDASKKEMEDYRRLLAYDMLYHKHIKDNKAVREKWAQMSEEEKIKVANELNVKALKIAKKSREWTIQKLVTIFVENNILPHPDRDKLNFEGAHLSPKYNNIKFAQFFVQNFHEIMEEKIKPNNTSEQRNMDFSEYRTLDYIYTNFESILKDSNKMVVTNLLNERLTLKDCDVSDLSNCHEGNEELKDLYSKANMSQEGFEELQKWFEEGKRISDKQVLKCREDKEQDEFSYEMIYKDNPIGLVLGNITNCCQRYHKDWEADSSGYDCVIIGETNPNSCFVAFKHGDKIVGQSWLWYNQQTKTVALDNIEVPRNLDKLLNEKYSTEFMACLKRLCHNIFEDMNSAGHEVDNMIIGAHATDVKKLEGEYPHIFEESKCLGCNLKLPNLSREVYSDAVAQGQYLVYAGGKYMGHSKEVTSKKQMEKEM